MELFKDKVLIRISKDLRESIFSKEITRDDGTKVKLFTNVEAQEIDDRKSTLFVQMGIVEAVAENVEDVEVGDIAIIDYKLCNMEERIFEKDGDDLIYWLDAKTTYHEESLIAYASRRSPRDQVAYLKGDYDNISMLLGVIRNDKLYAREPYVFLEHQSNQITKVSGAGILYSETQLNYMRTILSSCKESQDRYRLFPGQEIMVHDVDVFTVKIQDKVFDCVHDVDVLANADLVKSLSKVIKS